MAESRLLNLRPKSSPPPNCAICLGPYIDKCFSDPCMHQFCYNCLLQWSKIKAECPLCKQPVSIIIHNIKSNSEYDEHVIENENENGNDFHLPTEPARHQFHFRTTFTVDTRGEHAIQQMLLTHPLTRGQISFSNYQPRRRRRDVSSTNFRRSIYTNNMWVCAPPDVTGRFRDISPSFFRNYPAARQRLVPWLNRELNALLYENTTLVMHLVDRIMDYLLRHHICSRSYRIFLTGYLGVKTDHFVHEFYNFMRSPFDMIGYDRHIYYTTRPRSPTPYIDIMEEDNSESEVIVVSDGSSDGVETISIPPAPPIVIDSDSDDTVVETNENTPSTSVPRPIIVEDDDRPPILPLKLRLKNKRKRKHRSGRSKRRRNDSGSSSSCSSSSCSSDGPRMRRNYTIVNDICVISSDEDEVQSSHAQKSDSDDDLPLSAFVRKKSIVAGASSAVLDLSKKPNVTFDPNMPSCSFSSSWQPSPSESRASSVSRTPPLPPPTSSGSTEAEQSRGQSDFVEDSMPSCSGQTFPPTTQNSASSSKRRSSSSSSDSTSSSSLESSSSDDSYYHKKPIVKSEIHIKSEQTSSSRSTAASEGASGSSIMNFLIKNEEPSPLWYYPYALCSDLE